ncbi:hypothetical protein ACFTZB_40060 [Rhodococcus sp. NPDC057014]|uniref:hypothetical protein n=1 Tax=Rhodococcus sp. NPDC057014 TaxID=3346000 RepID=UPI00363902EC
MGLVLLVVVHQLTENGARREVRLAQRPGKEQRSGGGIFRDGAAIRTRGLQRPPRLPDTVGDPLQGGGAGRQAQVGDVWTQQVDGGLDVVCRQQQVTLFAHHTRQPRCLVVAENDASRPHIGGVEPDHHPLPVGQTDLLEARLGGIRSQGSVDDLLEQCSPECVVSLALAGDPFHLDSDQALGVQQTERVEIDVGGADGDQHAGTVGGEGERGGGECSVHLDGEPCEHLGAVLDVDHVQFVAEFDGQPFQQWRFGFGHRRRPGHLVQAAEPGDPADLLALTGYGNRAAHRRERRRLRHG